MGQQLCHPPMPAAGAPGAPPRPASPRDRQCSMGSAEPETPAATSLRMIELDADCLDTAALQNKEANTCMR